MKSRPVTTASYVFFSLIFTVPLILVLSNATFDGIKEVFKSQYYSKIMRFTLLQAAVSTLFSLIAGLPGAVILAKTDFRGKNIVRTVFSIPLILPSIITVLAFVIFYGNNGLLNKFLIWVFKLEQPPLKILYSFKTVILAHVFYNAPLFSIIISDSIENIDSYSLEAARCDCAGRFDITTKIMLPQVRNSIISSSCIVFLYCFTSFAIIMILGGGVSNTTSEVEIYRLAKINLDIEKACSLSIFSLTVASAVLAVQSSFQNKSIVNQERINRSKKERIHPVQAIYIIFAVLFIALPLCGVFVRALISTNTRAGETFISLKAFRSIDWKCFLKTFSIGLASSVTGTAVAFVMASDCSEKKSVFKSVYPMIPMAVSSVIMGLSYFIISLKLKNIPQSVLLVIVHSVIIIPFSFRTIIPSIQNIPEIYREEAKLEGCSSFYYIRKVLLPLTGNSVLSSVILGFAISCGELNSTLIIASGKFETVPVIINRQIQSYNFQGACASASVLITVCIVVFYFTNRLKENRLK